MLLHQTQPDCCPAGQCPAAPVASSCCIMPVPQPQAAGARRCTHLGGAVAQLGLDVIPLGALPLRPLVHSVVLCHACYRLLPPAATCCRRCCRCRCRSVRRRRSCCQVCSLLLTLTLGTCQIWTRAAAVCALALLLFAKRVPQRGKTCSGGGSSSGGGDRVGGCTPAGCCKG